MATKDALTGLQYRTVMQIDTTGGTVYYADQAMTISSQPYVAKVLRWGNIPSQSIPGEDVIKVSSFSCTLINYPRIDNVIKPGDAVRVYRWFFGESSSTLFVLFSGNISDSISFNVEEFRFSARDKGEFFDKTIGTILTVEDARKAAFEDLGKMRPIGYGVIKNHRCLGYEVSQYSVLREDFTAGGTVLKLSDASRWGLWTGSAYSTTGKLKIGDYENISYTQSGSDLTISANTVNDDFRAGTNVFEWFIAQSHLIFDHTIKDATKVTSVKYVPNGRSIDEAILVDPTNYNVNPDSSGKSFVILDDEYPVYQDKAVSQKIENQPDLTPLHDIFMDLPVKISFSGTAEVDVERMCDGLFYNYARFSNYTILAYKCYRVKRIQPYGKPSKVRAVINCLSDVGSADLTLYLFIGGVGVVSLDFSTTTSPANYQTAQYTLPSTFDWEDFQDNSNNYVRLDDDGAFANSVHVFEMWMEVEYDLATLGGNSVADQLPGYIICDVEGQDDNATGHYTGTANSTIEKPWEIWHHLIETYSNGATHSDIDFTALTEVFTQLPSSYKFAFVINRQIKLNRLLSLLATQAFCRATIEQGIYTFLKIAEAADSTDSTLNSNTDSVIISNKIPIDIEFQSLGDIKNDIDIKYYFDWSKNSIDDWDAYRKTENASDSTSITAYGERKAVFLFFAVGDNSAMATSLVTKYLQYWKNPKRKIKLPCIMKHSEVFRGHIFSTTVPQFSISSQKYEVIERNFIPADGKRDQMPLVWFMIIEVV